MQVSRCKRFVQLIVAAVAIAIIKLVNFANSSFYNHQIGGQTSNIKSKFHLESFSKFWMYLGSPALQRTSYVCISISEISGMLTEHNGELRDLSFKF